MKKWYNAGKTIFAKASLNRTSRESESKRTGVKDPSHLTLYMNSSEDHFFDQKVFKKRNINRLVKSHALDISLVLSVTTLCSVTSNLCNAAPVMKLLLVQGGNPSWKTKCQ